MIKAVGILGVFLFLVGSILLARLREPRMPYRALLCLGIGIALMGWSSTYWSEATRTDLGTSEPVIPDQRLRGVTRPN